MASKVTTQLVIDGKNNSKAAFNEVNKQLDSMNTKIESAGVALKGLISVAVLQRAAAEYANLADQGKLIETRLKLATKSQEEFNRAATEVRRIANENGAALTPVVQLYSRLAPVMREAGRSQEDILKVTEAVSKSLRISGASTAEATSTLIQFSQAMGSGVLRGEEFNALAENSPRLLQALADSLGVPTGALRDMAKAGELTSDVLANALIEQLPKLAKEAEAFGDTFGTASQRLQNAALDLVGAFDKLTGTSERATKAMVSAAEAISGLAANDKPLQNTLKLLEEVAALTPLVGLYKVITDPLKESLKQGREGAEQEKSQHEYREGLFALHAKEMQVLRARDVADLKSSQEEMAKAAKKGTAALVSAEKKANSELKKIRDERLDIDKRYQEALAGLNGDGEASYGGAQALKVGARQALQNGDIAGAQAQAQAALKMLQDLAAAGENTYGFGGFIKELQAIELAANDIEQTNAEDKLKAIKAEMLDVQTKAAALKDMQVSLKMDDTALAAVKKAIDDLASTKVMIEVGAQYDFSTPYTMVDPGPEPQGFATGGHVRGPGSGTSDSIMARLSNGEYVMRAAAVKQYGTTMLDKMNGLHMPRFADGGLVSAAMSAPGAQPGRDLGRVDLNIGGEKIGLLADGDQFDRILKRTAVKFGRTR
ncbi:tape measure protein [Pseudomonas paeninsulae]|uniref:tape measure protein n=1 Tax=Pseudomonas paeninsulae TaxID=3110772 RepID=UPI002D765146|nr:tape measure protein [Pseudomonas sp. IT1137]